MQVNSNIILVPTRKKRIVQTLMDVVVLAAMGILLFMGSSSQIFKVHSDGARYQCYAIAFLNNVQFAKSSLPSQCGYILGGALKEYTNTQIAADMHSAGAPEFLVNFVVSQDVSQRFHALPHEYPLLTLIPFLFVMLFPVSWYQIVFALLMIVLAAGVYVILAHYKSRTAAIVGAALLVIGGWGTVAGRFDLVPSFFTLLAVVLAERKRWTGAFVLLALAFLLKFYPIMVLLPFLLGQQMDSGVRWNAWRRWRPLAAFFGLCVLVMSVSLLLSVEGTLAPLSYFQARPIQAESFGSSILWLSTFVQYHTLRFEFTYGSLNVVHIFSPFVASSETLLEIVGLVAVAWLQWRRKIDLAMATLLTLLVVMVTGKVFSPQYLIWVVPLVAYVGGTKPYWIVAWVAIGALTTFVYPYIYAMTDILDVARIPLFYPVVTLRNFLLCGFVIAVLISSSRRKVVARVSYHPAVHNEEKT